MGPLGLTFLAVAVLSAFLRAKYDLEARHHTTSDSAPDGAGDRPRPLGLRARERLTPEGERILRRARLFRLMLYLFGFAALAATWLGY